ncbi:hypothetical protein BsWGS_17740 [Bradybaena similaris]
MPAQSNKKPLSAKKDTSDKCLTLESFAFLAIFLFVNGVAAMVRLDLAIMMLVPNIFVLCQMGLIDQMKGCGLALFAIGLMAIVNIESFYILASHCFFYLFILLKQRQEEHKN